MENRRNYYRILHVQPDAPVEIIRSSYRTLMQRLRKHPDLGGDHWNAALINEAYRVLTDPASRERYDSDRELIIRTDPQAWEDIGPELPDDPPAETGRAPDHVCGFCLAPHGQGLVEDPDAVCSRCDSPLFRTEHARHEETGQRTVRRISRDLAVAFFATWPQAAGLPGRTLDVSPNGMRFVTEHRVSEGQRLKITSTIFDTVAWVTHCQVATEAGKASWIVGVAFETLKFNRSRGAFVSTRV